MGVTIRERDGAWWVYICHQGKRKARRIGDKKAATIVAGKIQAKLALGDFNLPVAADPGRIPTFEQVAIDWERKTSPSWKRGTQTSYGNILRHRLLTTFGSLPITDITANRVEEWWTAAREEDLSKAYLRAMRAILRGICRRAVSLGLLPVNPIERIEGRLGRQDTEIRQADYLTGEDLTTLLTKAQEVCPREYPVFLVMATAGLRISEAKGLQVGDVDVPGQRLHVRRQVRRGYISSPKNGKGRVVDLPASTVAILEQVRQTRQAEAAYNGVEARWLFPGVTGDMPTTDEVIRRALRLALRAAGIRSIRIHTLRHTFATLLVESGVALLTVSRQLGHADIGTTANTYAHVAPGGNRAAAEALEAVLTGNQTQPPRNLPA